MTWLMTQPSKYARPTVVLGYKCHVIEKYIFFLNVKECLKNLSYTLHTKSKEFKKFINSNNKKFRKKFKNNYIKNINITNFKYSLEFSVK